MHPGNKETKTLHPKRRFVNCILYKLLILNPESRTLYSNQLLGAIQGVMKPNSSSLNLVDVLLVGGGECNPNYTSKPIVHVGETPLCARRTPVNFQTWIVCANYG